MAERRRKHLVEGLPERAFEQLDLILGEPGFASEVVRISRPRVVFAAFVYSR